MFKQGNVLTLSDNKDYVVVADVLYDNKKYYYLIEENDYKNIIFGQIENDELIIIDDTKLLQKLFKLVTEKLKSSNV